jgi:mannitol PTS system EIIA component
MADATLADLLSADRVVLGGTAGGWEDAVRQVGDVLVSSGAVSPDYVDAMVERERSISTFVGEGVAIPHGTLAGRDLVSRDTLCVVQFPAGVDWHGPILARLAELLMEPDRAAALRTAATPGEVVALLAPEEPPT